MADVIVGAHMYLTLDEDNQDQVLELVRVDGEKMFVRSDDEWLEIDPDADNDRVWDRVIVDVDDSAIDIFDASADNPVIERNLFDSAVIPDEDGK